ncbi:uncharacterized protein LOC104894161 [Beta vulgaris subsp. vulgaris]|uniref:uncharacterized protein LOC104894161 n=1 Tax=Beta vulgaris subsp. vulgaris TaxID=3555 RepID=UPI002036DE77|nr:uncharacterized protein LOC104894161 [Beta vulgaris subsp. vulgaris]
MAHNPTNRRKLAATPDPPPISQTTGKKHPKTSTSTIYNLTNHFSRLHPNPTKPLNTHNPLPQKHLDTLLQAKSLSKSVNLEPSKHSFGQNFGKQGKRVVLESGNKNKSLVGVVEEVESKKELKKVEKGESKKDKLMVVKPTLVGNGIGKRRSFCDAKVELANFLITNCAKVVSADMPPFMQIHSVGFARKIKDSLEKFTSKNLALSLKKELDGVYGPAWHCIVGTSFGSFVTHSVGGFMYFSLDQKLYVLIFKTTVQKLIES